MRFAQWKLDRVRALEWGENYIRFTPFLGLQLQIFSFTLKWVPGKFSFTKKKVT